MKISKKIKDWWEICNDPFIIEMSIIILLIMIAGCWKLSNDYNRRQNVENSIHKLTQEVDSLSIELKMLKGNVTE